MKRLQKGDVVKCRDLNEMLNMDKFLAHDGYSTDYKFRHNGERVFWLVIDSDERKWRA